MSDISPKTLDEVRQHLTSAVAAKMAGTPHAAAPINFCALYQQARPILLSVENILGIFLPQVAAVIGALVSLGDKVCPAIVAK